MGLPLGGEFFDGVGYYPSAVGLEVVVGEAMAVEIASALRLVELIGEEEGGV